MEYINNQIYKNYIKKQKGGKLKDTTNALKYLVGLPKQIETEEKNLETILKDHSSLTKSELKSLKESVMNFKLDIDSFNKGVIEYKRPLGEIDYENPERNSLEQIDGISFGDVQDGEKVRIPIKSIDLSIYLKRLKSEVEKLQKSLSDMLTFSRFDDIPEENLNNEIQKLESLKSTLETKLEQVKSIKVTNNFILETELIDEDNFLSALTKSSVNGLPIKDLESRFATLLSSEVIGDETSDEKFMKFAKNVTDSGELLSSFDFQKELLDDISKIDTLLKLVKPTKYKEGIEFIPKSFLELLIVEFEGKKINIFDLKAILIERSTLIDTEISNIKSELEQLKSSNNPIIDAINKFLKEETKFKKYNESVFGSASMSNKLVILNDAIRVQLETAIKAIKEEDKSDDTYYEALKSIYEKFKTRKDHKDILLKRDGSIVKIAIDLKKAKGDSDSSSIKQQISDLETRLKKLESDKLIIISKNDENNSNIERFEERSRQYPWIQVGGLNEQLVTISNKRFLLLNQIFSITLDIKTELYKVDVQVKKIQEEYDLINFIKFIILLIYRYNFRYGNGVINTNISSKEIKFLLENINKITSNLGNQDVSVSNFLKKYITILNLTLEICNELDIILNKYKSSTNLGEDGIVYIKYDTLSEQNKVFVIYLKIIYQLIENLSNLIVI